ncbi:hypothetical protein [Shewanella youngdeokensis]|uniref:Uncharacterized protein n=1 Tax=Shewanella youngdeokensis TaxID=2999068 RepID=A0ABZ0JVM2_9GAMM|nr:hypothetical protein RGE70_13705 [Shewanella sp. DAU334]
MDTNSAVTPKSSPDPISMPKRLIALLVILVLMSLTGLMVSQGVLFCILTLFMVLAIIGKQKAGLIMLRVYTALQWVIASMLPLALYNPDNSASALATLTQGSLAEGIPDWILFGVLLAIATIEVIIAFTRKVSRYFNREVNLNIMR